MKIKKNDIQNLKIYYNKMKNNFFKYQSENEQARNTIIAQIKELELNLLKNRNEYLYNRS